jgi:hypothetical protein
MMLAITVRILSAAWQHRRLGARPASNKKNEQNKSIETQMMMYQHYNRTVESIMMCAMVTFFVP